MSPKAKCRLIDLQHPVLSIQDQCKILGLNRSTFYYQPAQETSSNLLIMREIDKIHMEFPFYGYRKIFVELNRLGYHVNTKRIRRLMKKMGIVTLYPKPKLSIPGCPEQKYPYLLRDVAVEYPNQVWSTDITYIPLSGGFVYLVAVMDWYSRYVLSWELSNTLDEEFCIEALDEALLMGKPEIFNTDQGAQFTGKQYTGRLQEECIAISWDGKGRALDNVFIERVWRSLKYEKVYPECFTTVPEVYRGIEAYFYFYNEKRPHQSLDYLTPARVYYGYENKNI